MTIIIVIVISLLWHFGVILEASSTSSDLRACDILLFLFGTCVGGGFKGGGFKKYVTASCVCVATVLFAMLS